MIQVHGARGKPNPSHARPGYRWYSARPKTFGRIEGKGGRETRISCAKRYLSSPHSMEHSTLTQKPSLEPMKFMHAGIVDGSVALLGNVRFKVDAAWNLHRAVATRLHPFQHIQGSQSYRLYTCLMTVASMPRINQEYPASVHPC